MELLGRFHHIKCPWGRPGYFTSVVAIVGDTITLVDAGTRSSPREAILPYLESIGRQASDISHIVLTHGHGDHADGVPALLRASPAQVYVHKLEVAPVKRLVEEGGLYSSRVTAFTHGDVLDLGGGHLEIIHTPGHSVGAICALDRQNNVCISGDAIQGRGQARPLLFYSAVAYANSIQRLSREPIDLLLMGHPFPPLEQGVVRGPDVTKILEESERAVNEIVNQVVRLLETSGRPLSTEDILQGASLRIRDFTLDLLLQALAEEGRVSEIGTGDDRLWLAREPGAQASLQSTA